MRIIQDIDELPFADPMAVSIGNFDGIHKGHRMLISELCQQAMRLNLESAVVTFDPHPIEILKPGARVPKLTSVSRKSELLKQCGVDYLVVLPTNKELLELDYLDFFRKFVVDRFRARVMVEGRNFFFGKDRVGDTEKLQTLCLSSGITLSLVDIIQSDSGEVTSSSMIRKQIRNGDILDATRMLEDNYQLEGRVVEGASRGREIGFPTANLSDVEVLIPGEGVYAGRAKLQDEWQPSAIHIGPNPTFEDGQLKVEVHLLDKQVSLYGQRLKVEILHRVRGVKKFENRESLVAQIKKDIDQIRDWFAANPIN